jgi:hypothetical protein
MMNPSCFPPEQVKEFCLFSLFPDIWLLLHFSGLQLLSRSPIICHMDDRLLEGLAIKSSRLSRSRPPLSLSLKKNKRKRSRNKKIEKVVS